MLLDDTTFALCCAGFGLVFAGVRCGALFLLACGVCVLNYAFHCVQKPVQTVVIAEILRLKKQREAQSSVNNPLIASLMVSALLVANRARCPAHGLDVACWLGIGFLACCETNDLGSLRVDAALYALAAGMFLVSCSAPAAMTLGAALATLGASAVS